MAAGSSDVAATDGPGVGMSANAFFLFTNVFKAQTNVEAARRYFPVLRQWAESKKVYRGHTFTMAEVEEVIAKFEREVAAARAPSGRAPSAPAGPSSSSAAPAGKAAVDAAAPQLDCWWPRWVLDTRRGIEVLAPSGPGKLPSWVHATPVGIGYRGQKRRYLFVRSPKFEMDCRRREVRMPGGGPTVEDMARELAARGEDPARHPDWTDGTDVNVQDPTRSVNTFVTPGVAPEGSDASCGQAPLRTEGSSALLEEELTAECERMALLHRSPLVKIRTCDHPDPLSEPRASASISLPPLTENDVLGLPAQTAQERLSSLQLETVCFAARRFRTPLPDGRAAGYLLGDGTGCGKGRVISALMYHLWNQGHRRSVWVSATSDLYHDACRDLQDLGADIPCMSMKKLPPSGPLDRKGSEAQKELVKQLGVEGDGIIFLTYSLLVQTGQRRNVFAAPVRTEENRRLLLGELLDDKLRCVRSLAFGDDKGTVELKVGDRVVGVKSLRELQACEVPFTVSFERVLQRGSGDGDGMKSSKDGSEYTPWNSRLGQLVAWLGGSSATGLICFDEVHKAKNLVPDKMESASTKTGLFVDLLQSECPKAPVLYVSATAATEVQHLGYMSRLGVWGVGSAFDNFSDFMRAIENNGVAAMEMFAINMKAIGALSCRALAYVGTEFVTQQCGLSEEQTKMYNVACQFWQHLLHQYRKYITADELTESYRKRWHFKKSQGTEELGLRLWQSFWGCQQRFFKAMCNSFKVPAACEAAREAIKRGEQVVISIWATGESRSRKRMEEIKEQTAGRVVIESIIDGGINEVTVDDPRTLEKIASCLLANLRLSCDISVGGTRVARLSCLQWVHGKRIHKPEDLVGVPVPAPLIFRAQSLRQLTIAARLTGTDEPVKFELTDDALGERVIVKKVVEGPPEFRRAELEAWHIKTIGKRPVGKLNLSRIRSRMRKGQALAFQDPVIPEHLSGPQMILEFFLNTQLLTKDEKGQDVQWAVETKAALIEEAMALQLPPNAMDEVVDQLGGSRNVAEMSGRSHRMKRRRDGSLAYVARTDELRCPLHGANLVEQVFFQKGSKKACLVTEVASAGISLHADRRQVRKDFQPPRRTMISLELPWGADKAIQVFGRVHRANQLVPPRFINLCTTLGGEVRFISAIARRMKLLGAVTKGDRMASMGGTVDRHMQDFDVNNFYGVRALVTLYKDTTTAQGAMPELLGIYEALPFIGDDDEGEATGRWPTWEDFREDAKDLWKRLNLSEEFDLMVEKYREDLARARPQIRESSAITRFLNRILMLEVEVQNAIFEVFVAIYTELVRVDRSNGVYDEGIENLNRSQGRWIKNIQVDHREILYTDPASGSQTQYVRLSLDRGITWQDAKRAYDELMPNSDSLEGFYAFEASPGARPVYVLVKERQQLGGAGSTGTTWVARRRQKQYILWGADYGVRTGLQEGRAAYSAQELIQDERYIRVDDTEEALRVAEEAWTRSYDESAAKRLSYEHILTGDVLTAWRFVFCGAQADDSAQLQIVRAVTQPDGIPVVGMRVVEADVPKLRYVLTAQQKFATQELDAKEKGPSARDVALIAAELLLQRLVALPEKSLPCTSWLDVHKLLAEDSKVPSSINGLRGTQMGIERLLKKRLLSLASGSISLSDGWDDAAPATGEMLEMLLFPEEFDCVPGQPEEEGLEPEDPDDDLGQDLADLMEDDDVAQSEAADDLNSDDELNGNPPAKEEQDSPVAAKKRRTQAAEQVSKVSTPVKAWKAHDDVSEKAERPQRKASDKGKRKKSRSERDKKEGKERRHKKKHKRDEEDVQKKNRDMAKELFGESDAESEAPLPSAEGEAAPPPGAAKEAAAEPGLLSRETGYIWTFEVTGKKLSIREKPTVDDGNNGGHGYLSPGEFFNVTEKLRGQDGRTYLRLADGRGWAYDRSAKDVAKVVVKELACQPVAA